MECAPTVLEDHVVRGLGGELRHDFCCFASVMQTWRHSQAAEPLYQLISVRIGHGGCPIGAVLSMVGGRIEDG